MLVSNDLGRQCAQGYAVRLRDDLRSPCVEWLRHSVSTLKRYLFRVLRRRNNAHFLVRDDAKPPGEVMGSV